MNYHERRHPHLPWGHWLHAQGMNALVDEQGRRWTSVRECFAIDRLGLAKSDRHDHEEELERVLTFLAAISRRIVAEVEHVTDIFGGSRVFYQHYKRWLNGLGFLDNEQAGPDKQWAPLSAEGNAVLLMLAATRSHKLAAIPIGTEALKLFTPDMTNIQREIWFAEVAAYSARLPQRFERTQIHEKYAVVLVGRDMTAAVPVKRTLWSGLFAEAQTRNDFFEWLCKRTDRWGAWAGSAHKNGAVALTAHLLELVSMEMSSTVVAAKLRPVPDHVIALPDLTTA